jgi:hypothetical protein
MDNIATVIVHGTVVASIFRAAVDEEKSPPTRR